MTDRTYARIALGVEQLGLPDPPTAMELELIPAPDGWEITAWFLRGARSAARGWLAEITGSKPRSRGRAASRRLGARSSRLPARLSELTDRFGNVQIALEPCGSAELIVEGRRADVRAVLDRWELDPERALVELRTVPPRQATVTDEQRHALRAAWEHGYFQVPRRISTRELADRVDKSPSSLSETLRRGVENIVGEWVRAPRPTDGREHRLDLADHAIPARPEPRACSGPAAGGNAAVPSPPSEARRDDGA